MFKRDVISHFSRASEVCRVLGLTSGSVSQWGDVIPEKQALKLDRITAGKLQYDPALYVKAA